MVVNTPLPPEAGLVVEDVPFFVECFVTGSPEDAARMVGSRSSKALEVRVVFVECLAVIIPMNGHGEGIGNE